MSYRKFLLWGLVWFCYWLLSPTAVAKTLRVGTNQLPPFVFVKSAEEPPIGYSVELWDKLARQLNLEYQIIIYDSTAELVKAVKEKQVDVAISGITITSEREQFVDFSQSYYETGLQILILDRPKNPILAFVNYVISWTTLQAFVILLILSLISAHLIWLFERHSNPEMFPKKYSQGIWDALWWSLVTAATVGYGDKFPKGFVGRTIAIFWMILGVLVFAYLTASITANKIRYDISAPNDLDGKRVAAVRGTTSAAFLRQRPLKLIEVKHLDLAYQALREGKVDAVVGDAPTLKYQAAQKQDLQVVGEPFEKQSYGIAFPQGSPYREPINVVLLQLKEESQLKVLDEKWFSNNP